MRNNYNSNNSYEASWFSTTLTKSLMCCLVLGTMLCAVPLANASSMENEPSIIDNYTSQQTFSVAQNSTSATMSMPVPIGVECQIAAATLQVDVVGFGSAGGANNRSFTISGPGLPVGGILYDNPGGGNATDCTAASTNVGNETLAIGSISCIAAGSTIDFTVTTTDGQGCIILELIFDFETMEDPVFIAPTAGTANLVDCTGVSLTADGTTAVTAATFTIDGATFNTPTSVAAPATNPGEYSDNCDATPPLYLIAIGSDLVTDPCARAYTLTWEVRDMCGNNTILTQGFTLNDNTDPAQTGAAYSGTAIADCIDNAPAFIPSRALMGWTDNCITTLTATETGGPAVATGDDCSWSITFNYTIADGCGNTATGSYMDSGGDTATPMLTGTAYAQVGTLSGCEPTVAEAELMFTDADALMGYTDNCAATLTVTRTATAVTGDDCGWTVEHTYTVHDACIPANDLTGQTYSENGEDSEKPMLTGTAYAQVGTLSGCEPTQAAAEAMFTDADALMGYTDNCAATLTVTRTLTEVTGDDCGWTVEHTYTVHDACIPTNDLTGQTYSETGGDTATPMPTGTVYSQIGTINDCEPTQAEAEAMFTDADALMGYTDDCAATLTVTRTATAVTGDDCNWTVEHTYTVHDACIPANDLTGQTYSDSGADATNPVAVLNTTLNITGTLADLYDPGVLDNDGGSPTGQVMNTAVVVDAGCDVTMDATDFLDILPLPFMGSNDNCTDRDMLIPEIRDPNNSANGNGAGAGPWGATATFTEGGGNLNFNDFNFNNGCATTFRLQYRVRDLCGNISNVINIDVPVVDEIDPVVVDPGDIVDVVDAGCDATFDVDFDVPTDNCGDFAVTFPVLTFNTSANVTGPLLVSTGAGLVLRWSVTGVGVSVPGTPWVGTITATDPCGNAGIATFDVTVTDPLVPTITCSGAVTADTDLDVCNALVQTQNAQSNDNCAVFSMDITFGAVTGDLNPPIAFPPAELLAIAAAPGGQILSRTYEKGVTEITYEVTDINGLTASCTQTVTVTDNQNPTTDLLQVPDATNYNYKTNDGADCPGVAFAGNMAAAIPSTPFVIPQNGAPIMIDMGGGNMHTLFDHSDFADNCDVDDGVLTITDFISDGNTCNESILIIYTYADCGRTTQGAATAILDVVQAIVITDNTNPVFMDPSDVELKTSDPASCPATGVGTLVVGNDVGSEIAFTVAGVSQTGPKLVAAAPANPGEYYDACQTATVDVVSISANTGDACDAVYTIEWRVNDGCGQSVTQMQEFTVEDDTDPLFMDPADVALKTSDPASCPATGVGVLVVGNDVGSEIAFTVAGVGQKGPKLVAAAPANPGEYYDECQTATVDVVSISANTGDACDAVYTIEWRVNDGCGQSVTEMQEFTVEDDTDPLFMDPSDVALTTNGGAMCPATGVGVLVVGNDVGSEIAFTVAGVGQTGPKLVTAAPANPGEYYDECQTATVDVVSISANTGDDCDAVYTIEWRVNDGCGQSVTKMQEFTVEDNTDPVFNDPSDEALSTLNDGASCPDVGFEGTLVSGQSVASGYMFTVSGVTLSAPTIDLTNSSTAAGTYYDVCQTATLTAHTVSGNTGTSCDAIYTIVWRVDDGCGQTTDLDQVITVTDNTPPTLTAPTPFGGIDPLAQVVCTTSGDCNQSAFIKFPTATDNCDPIGGMVTNMLFTDAAGNPSSITAPIFPISLAMGQVSIDFPIDLTNIALEVTDMCGNTSTQNYTVTVLDCTVPTASNCPDAIINANTSDDGTGDCSTDVTWDNPSFDDNCVGGTMTITFSDPGGNPSEWDLPIDPSTGMPFTGAGPHVTYTGTVAHNQPETFNFSKGTTTVEITHTDAGPGGIPNPALPGTALPGPSLSVTCTSSVVVADDELPTLLTPVTTPIALTTTGGADCPATAGVSGIVDGPVAFGATYTVGGISYTAPAQADFSDNCKPDETLSVTITPTIGTCSSSFSLVWLYEDCGGNPISQTQVYTVTDNEAPTLSGALPDNSTSPIIDCMPDQATADSYFDNTIDDEYTDDCGTPAIQDVVSTIAGGDCSWTVTHTFNINDGCNNLTAGSYVTHGGDTTAPTGLAPAGNAAPGYNACMPADGAAAIASYFSAATVASGYSDICSGATTAAQIVNVSAVVAGDDCSWTVDFTYDVVDACGQTLSGETYQDQGGDKMAPSGTAPSGNSAPGYDACIPADGPAAIAAYFNAATVATGYSDICSGQTTAAQIVNVSAVVGGDDCSWTIDYTYDVVDACGQVLASESYQDVGADKTGPLAFDESDQTLFSTPSDCNQNVFIDMPGTTDACGGVVLETIAAPGVSFGLIGSQWQGLFPVGTTIATITATDKCGNTTTDEVTVTIIDNIMPTISACPSPQTVSADTGTCEKDVTIQDAAADDNCTLISLAVTYAAGPPAGCPDAPAFFPADRFMTGSTSAGGQNNTATFAKGVTRVTYTFTDNAANAAGTTSGGTAFPAGPNVTSCYVDITVEDNERPTLEEEADDVLLQTSNGGSVTCPGTGTTLVDGPVAFGSTFMVAGQAYTAPADTDFADNCNDNNTTPLALSATVSTTGAADACQEVITITWDVTDCDGNSLLNPDVQVFTIEDKAAPQLTGTLPTPAAVDACTPDAATAAGYFDSAAVVAAYSDDCGTPTLQDESSSVSGGDCSWTVTHTWNVNDGCGNLTAGSYMTTGGDDSAPIAGDPVTDLTGIDACEAGAAAAVEAASSEATEKAAIAAASTDNCATLTASNVTKTNEVVSGVDCQSAGGWTVTRTYTVTDDCNKTSSPVTVVHSGYDQTTPMGSAPADLAAPGHNDCIPASGAAAIAAYFDAATVASGYSDVCSGQTTAAQIVNVTAAVNGTDCAWTVDYTYDVVDACGRTLSGETYQDAGSDKTAPTFDTNIADQTLNITSGDCNQDVFIQKPGLSDNCGIDSPFTFMPASLSISASDPNINFGDLDTRWNADFPAGTTTVTLTATDICGNTATDEILITVNDLTPPTIVGGCPSDIVVASAVPCNSSATFTIPSVTDPCGTTGVDISYSGPAPLPANATNVAPGTAVTEIFTLGTTTVTLTAYNVSGISSSCTFTVTSNCDVDSPCVDTLYVPTVDITTFGPVATFSANKLVHSDAVIQNGNDITYLGGDEVQLTPGFETKLGVLFLADIAPCILPPVNGGNPFGKESGLNEAGDGYEESDTQWKRILNIMKDQKSKVNDDSK